MTGLLKKRQPSPLQRRVLIVLAALDAKRPGPVATRDIERMLAQGGEDAVYGNNLRASCRRMEETGWLRTLRAPNLQLFVELTEAGRPVAAELLAEERAQVLAGRRAAEVVVLPSRDARPADTANVVTLNGTDYQAVRGDYVIRLDGRTCLQLTDHRGVVRRIEGDALAVAGWYQACQAAGLPGHVQVNAGPAPGPVATVTGHGDRSSPPQDEF